MALGRIRPSRTNPFPTALDSVSLAETLHLGRGWRKKARWETASRRQACLTRVLRSSVAPVPAWTQAWTPARPLVLLFRTLSHACRRKRGERQPCLQSLFLLKWPLIWFKLGPRERQTLELGNKTKRNNKPHCPRWLWAFACSSCEGSSAFTCPVPPSSIGPYYLTCQVRNPFQAGRQNRAQISSLAGGLQSSGFHGRLSSAPAVQSLGLSFFGERTLGILFKEQVKGQMRQDMQEAPTPTSSHSHSHSHWTSRGCIGFKAFCFEVSPAFNDPLNCRCGMLA